MHKAAHFSPSIVAILAYVTEGEGPPTYFQPGRGMRSMTATLFQHHMKHLWTQLKKIKNTYIRKEGSKIFLARLCDNCSETLQSSFPVSGCHIPFETTLACCMTQVSTKYAQCTTGKYSNGSTRIETQLKIWGNIPALDCCFFLKLIPTIMLVY